MWEISLTPLSSSKRSYIPCFVFLPKEQEHGSATGQCRALRVPALFSQRNTPTVPSLPLNGTKQPSQIPLPHL